ncbi:MAG: glutaredoxin family protein [Cyanobacteria bacterium J06638_20]
MDLVLYSKPGCHLCEGLQEKLEQIQGLPINLEVRDITTNPEWFAAYQYEIPVLHWGKEKPVALPRLSPRASVQQVEQMLRKYLDAS